MSWGRIENPKKVFKSGDKVKVLVKAIDGNRIALSMKFPEENPWKDAEEKFAVGTVVTGKVARMTDFGAFVELSPNKDGLIHISKLADHRVEKVEDVVNIGDVVKVKVLEVDRMGKISLSLKDAEQ